MQGEPGTFAITLFVRDRTAKALGEDVALQRVVLDGAADLDFLSPAWWEGSHTAALGLMDQGADGQGRQSLGDKERGMG